MSYIKKELLLADILDAKIKNTQEESQRVLSIFERMVQRQPDADVVEVRHGEWELYYVYANDYSNDNVHKVFRCSLCGRTEKQKEPYCNCGAKMDGERREEE